MAIEKDINPTVLNEENRVPLGQENMSIALEAIRESGTDGFEMQEDGSAILGETMMEEVETLSFEERLKRVGKKKMSPLNFDAMATNDYGSNVVDEDAFSPIHLVGKKARTSDTENDSIGFKLQSIDPLVLQRRTNSSSSSSSTRYSQNT